MPLLPIGANYISENGFITTPKSAHFQADSVVVLTAKNCSKAAAKRAGLPGIQRNDSPCTRTNSVNFSDFDPSPGKRLDSVMKDKLPIALFDGRGKANLTPGDVIAANIMSVYE